MFSDVHLGEAVTTWIVFAVPGWFAWPLLRRAFPKLPDGGYAIARTVGLLLWTYVCWLIASVSPIPYGNAMVWIVGVAWVLVGGYVALRDREALGALWKEVLCVEAVFLVTMVLWLAVVPYNTEVISSQERYMDYAFMARMRHTTHFPPLDMWMSGKKVQYYYYGYVIMDVARRVTSIELSRFLAYGLVANYAMFACATYGAAYTLSRKRLLAVASVVLAMLGGNLHVWREWITTGSIDKVQWFYAARVMFGSITEFPLFSLTFGDFHPYVLAFPAVMASITLAIVCFQSSAPLGKPTGLAERTEREGLTIPVWVTETARAVPRAIPPWPRMLAVSALIGVVVGSLFPTNSWDYPTFAAAVFGAIFVSTWLSLADAEPTDRLAAALVAAGWAGLVSVILYLPFNLSFGAQQGSRGFLLVTRRSDVHEMLIHWGPLLVAAGLYAWMARPSWRRLLAIAGIGSLALLGFELGVRPWLAVKLAALPMWLATFLHFVFLSGQGWILGAALLISFVFGLNRKRLQSHEQVAVLCGSLGLLVMLGVEIVYLNDHYGGEMERMNTVFKAYNQVWLLLSVPLPFLVVEAIRRVQRKGLRIAAIVLMSICGVSLGGYATIGAWQRYNHFKRSTGGGKPGMDATAGFARRRATRDDAVAAEWVDENLPPDAVIIEATENAYAWAPRISTFTGRLGVIGWVNHEAGWRNDWTEPRERSQDLETIYTTPSLAVALKVCRKYHADYIYVGRMERSIYGSTGLTKFSTLETVYSRDSVTIYRVPPK